MTILAKIGSCRQKPADSFAGKNYFCQSGFYRGKKTGFSTFWQKPANPVTRSRNLHHLYLVQVSGRRNFQTDLGVWFDEKLMLGLIKRNFKHVTSPTFVMLYKSMVRSHLDCCCIVWTPDRKGDIEALEKVQKRATKMLPALKNLSYKDRLKACNISTLYIIDVSETFKILTGDALVSPTLITASSCITRGNNLRLQKNRFKYDLRKYCFTNRVVNIWNSLPNYVVYANTTNVFKNRLDKFWQDQEIIYDFKTQLEGTGSRSGVE